MTQRKHIRAVYEQMAIDRKDLEWLTLTIVDQKDKINEYLNRGNWRSASVGLHKLDGYERSYTYIKSRLAINKDWLDDLKRGGPLTDQWNSTDGL